ncbi:PP2C family protein-serine/threonine phosphatase [Streptomyces sp. NPDC020917]|uniref:PP2C family protein-serine/threonine phosphatase n=1 Tax=Streptomyces sp. NPDC020917 TaxID=3365102 RepID=UPI0037B599F4
MPTRDDEAVDRTARLTRAVALVSAVLLYGLVIGMELGTPPHVHIAAVLVAVPALIAMDFGPPMIIGAAVLAVATRWAFLNLDPGRVAPAIGTTAAIVAVTGVGCFVVIRRRRVIARLSDVTSAAEATQRAVLRPPPPSIGPYEIAASYRAAAQFARIGGDLYGVADTHFGVRALIGDVRGKGLDAVATTAAVLGSFNEAAYDRPTLPALATQLEVSLRRHRSDEEAFVTALLIEFGRDGLARALVCGHPAPLILRGGAVLDVPATPGLPLGLRGLPTADDDALPPATDLQLRHGDTVLMFTDGITEARDALGDFYPLNSRLTARLRDRPRPDALLEWLQEDARAYSDIAGRDDAALLALTWLPPQPRCAVQGAEIVTPRETKNAG